MPFPLLDRACSPADAVQRIPSCARVFVHGAGATPTPLLEALAARDDLDGVRLYHLHIGGPFPFAAPQLAGSIRSVSLFVGEALRRAVALGDADFIPVFLADIPGLFTSGAIPLDVALVQVSAPDPHGLCSLGTSVDAARAAIDSARVVIAEVNERMPRTHGHTAVPLSRFDAFICALGRDGVRRREPPRADPARARRGPGGHRAP